MKFKIEKEELLRVLDTIRWDRDYPIELEGELIEEHDCSMSRNVCDSCTYYGFSSKKIIPIPEWMQCARGCKCRTCNTEDKINELIEDRNNR